MMDALPELPGATGGAVPLPKKLVLLFLSDMKKIIMTLLAAAFAMSAPALADPIKEDEFFTPHAQGCMLLKSVPIMSKNSKQFLTLTNMRNWLIVIIVLLLMSLTLSSDHLMRSEIRFF